MTSIQQFPFSALPALALAPYQGSSSAHEPQNAQVLDNQGTHFEVHGQNSCSLNPEFRVSGYAEFGYRFTRLFSASACFDSYWFGESDVNWDYLAYQPESKSYQIGLKASLNF